MTLRYLTTTIIAGVALGAVPALAQSGNQQADYCQQGFSMADTNQDDYVSAEEGATAADWEFQGLDANDDGMISQTEWLDCRRAWLSAEAAEEGTSSTMPEIPDMAMIDEDGDGVLTQEEFMNAAGDAYDASTMDMSGAASTSAEASSATGDAAASQESDMAATDQQEEERMLLIRRMVFLPTQADRNRFGQMSREEMADRAAMQFIILDADADRTVDAKEWAQQESLRNDISDVLNMQFEAADTDTSGDISREEYEAAEQSRMEQAQQMAEEQGEASDVGAPVVYYTYPHVM